MVRSSVELVVDEFADLVDIWDEFLKMYFNFQKEQNTVLSVPMHDSSHLCFFRVEFPGNIYSHFVQGKRLSLP